MIDIGRAIRIRRAERGWSIEELAERSGYSPPTICNLENNRTKQPFFFMVEDVLHTLGLRLIIAEGDDAVEKLKGGEQE